jgi:four helix bundle protein
MQSEELKTVSAKPRARHNDLSDRLMVFTVEAIQATYAFPKSQVSSHICGQLIRSATSAGANYEEARAAQSRADFVHKLQVALKEIRETCYWMKLAAKLELPDISRWNLIALEANELLLILAKSVVTTKGIQK